jgi:hypothetical protein
VIVLSKSIEISLLRSAKSSLKNLFKLEVPIGKLLKHLKIG